jgi:hypothetical protein
MDEKKICRNAESLLLYSERIVASENPGKFVVGGGGVGRSGIQLS